MPEPIQTQIERYRTALVEKYGEEVASQYVATPVGEDGVHITFPNGSARVYSAYSFTAAIESGAALTA